MEVVAVSWGQPSWQVINGTRTLTSIIHKPSSFIEVTSTGISKNRTASHDAQIYIFFAQHYDYWTKKLGVDRSAWDWCHWGENITFRPLTSLDEHDFHLGDIWKVGEDVLLQVCGARVPCNKLSWRCGQKERWIKELADSGVCGVYLRILNGGIIKPGDQAVLVEKSSCNASVASITKLAFNNSIKTKDTLNLLVSDPNLMSMNKSLFQRKLSVFHDQELVDNHFWRGWREFIIARIANEGGDIKSFYLKPLDRKSLATYLPGQFVSIKLPNGTIRNWSISDWPRHDAPEYYRISIKKAADASLWMHTCCTEGTNLFLRSPMGRFHLDWTPMFPGRQIYISAGIGITPMLAMTKAHANHFAMSKVPAIWIHVIQDGSKFPFRREVLQFENGQCQSIIFFTKPRPEDILGKDFHFAGRPTSENLGRLLKESYTINPLNITPIDIPGHMSTFYICGPSAFEAVIRSHLQHLSVPDSLVHSELFSTIAPSSLSALETSNVRFRKQGKPISVIWKKTSSLTILEIAEQAGLEPEYGCRIGTCGSCKVKLKSGSVVGGLQPDNSVLICSARPGSENVEFEF